MATLEAGWSGAVGGAHPGQNKDEGTNTTQNDYGYISRAAAAGKTSWRI